MRYKRVVLEIPVERPFNRDRHCDQCQSASPKVTYNSAYDLLKRECHYCGYTWWEAPEGDPMIAEDYSDCRSFDPVTPITGA
mgnify:CR=1 FL=1